MRPIAVGDTLRRLAGKVLLRLSPVKDEVERLQPRQCGVGTPFATELIGMGFQRLADAFPVQEWAVLQVDVRNAFNTLDRSTMLKMALKKAPSIYNWLSWCYGEPCNLLCQGQRLAP